jgi:hypothetical protein
VNLASEKRTRVTLGDEIGELTGMVADASTSDHLGKKYMKDGSWRSGDIDGGW